MVKLEGLGFSHSLGGRTLPVFSGLDATFPAGSISAVIGPSGCGKTSLLRIVAGLARPSAGVALVDGAPVDGVRDGTSIIFQDCGLLPWKTVYSNAELGLLARGVPAAERRARVDPILEELSLARFGSMFPARLSGGMRQRVAVARALAAHSDLLLMDEPFSSLDAMTREALQETILEVQRRHGTTIILVTHSIDEAAYLADRVFVMGDRNPGRFLGVLDTRRRNGAAGGLAGDGVPGDAPDAGGTPSSAQGSAPVLSRPAHAAAAPSAPGSADSMSMPASSPTDYRADPRFAETCSALRRLLETPSEAANPFGPVPPASGVPTKGRTPGARLAVTLARMAFAATVVLALWAASAALLGKPFLPAPGSALARFGDRLADGVMTRHVAASFRRVALALVLFGPPAWLLGLLAGRSKALDGIASPFVYLLHPIPKVAFLPLLLLFLGLGDASKVGLMGLVIFGQMFTGGRDAARSINPGLVESVRSLGGGASMVVRHVVMPGTVPALLTALRVSLGTTIAVLFLSETFASMDGLGWYIMDAWARVDYPDMYAAIVALSLFGLFLYLAVDVTEAAACRWRETD